MNVDQRRWSALSSAEQSEVVKTKISKNSNFPAANLYSLKFSLYVEELIISILLRARKS